jgi:AcrR family transcriptional regulator
VLCLDIALACPVVTDGTAASARGYPHMAVYGVHLGAVSASARCSTVSHMAPGTAHRIAAEASAILGAEGEDAVSMRRVAAAVGITPMAIYRHFPNREALLRAVAERGWGQLSQRWGQRARQDNPRAELRRALNGLLDFALEQPRLYALLYAVPSGQGNHSGAVDFRTDESPVLSSVVAAVDEGMHRGVFEPDDVSEVALSIVALMHGLISMHHAGRLGLSDPEFRALCGTAMTRLLHGVGA